MIIRLESWWHKTDKDKLRDFTWVWAVQRSNVKSWDESRWRGSPNLFNRPIFSSTSEETADTSPMEDPRRVAWECGGITGAVGIQENDREGFEHIISTYQQSSKQDPDPHTNQKWVIDPFPQTLDHPNSAIIKIKSVNLDFNWDTSSWIVRQNKRGPTGSSCWTPSQEDNNLSYQKRWEEEEYELWT